MKVQAVFERGNYSQRSVELYSSDSIVLVYSMPRMSLGKHLTKRKSQPSPPLSSEPAARTSVKRKQWTDRQMRAAVKAVEEGWG